VLAGLMAHEGRTASSNTSAYCQARGRLKCEVLAGLHDDVAERLEKDAVRGRLWYGRIVKIVDGSSVSMPDTEKNQSAFPQPEGQKPGCGFPVARLAVIFSLLSGAVLDLAWGSLHVAETALSRRMWSRLSAGDVFLADRGFCSFADLWCLMQRGIDSVMRVRERRRRPVNTARTLGRNDRIVEWIKTKAIPIWMGLAEWKSMPDVLRLREILVTVDIKGFRSKNLTIVTTLLDARAYPTEAFVDLYRRRWLAELFLRDIKISMGMDVLRCKSPEMIERELRLFVIAYNLVRALILQAARTHKADPNRLSFKGTLSKVRSWAPELAKAKSKKVLRIMSDALLFQIAFDPVPDRPNRVEPRAVKRRPKQYSRLIKPRREYREIYHRSRYENALT